jgi:hypothetical protein
MLKDLHAGARELARERRKADPEHARALDRAKYARRMERDPEGFRAKRRAIEVRYHQKKLAKHTGVVVDFSDWWAEV